MYRHEQYQPRPANTEFDKIVFGLAVDDSKVKQLAEMSAEDGLDWHGTGEYSLMLRKLEAKYALDRVRAEKAYAEALEIANKNLSNGRA
jgi:hypothetical protein